MEVSVAEAAKALGVSRSQLHRVISGQSNITAELASRLEHVISGTTEAWLDLQAAYDAVPNRVKKVKRTPHQR